VSARNDGARPTPLTAINRTQRSEEVRLQIERAIRSGQFAPGERLPSERELVETFGVSRVSVREAIRALEALGFVKVYQGRGAFVTDRRSGFGEPLARWLELHRDEVLELLNVRGALDELASAGAAASGTKKKLAAIEAAQTAFAEAVATHAETAEVVAADVGFHLAVAEASGNRLLYDLLSDLHVYLAESRHAVLAPPNRPAQSASDHAAIVDAIRARDVEAARAATARHIDSVRRLVLAGLESPKRAASAAR
jgi:DNA-binding FadR family transcriptional regulator